MSVTPIHVRDRRHLIALGYAWRYFRHLGLVATVRAIARCTSTALATTEEPPADHVGDVVFRLATPSVLDHLTELERHGRGAIQRALVTEDHHWLFVACYGDHIVATRRYCDPVPPHGLMSRVVRLR